MHYLPNQLADSTEWTVAEPDLHLGENRPQRPRTSVMGHQTNYVIDIIPLAPREQRLKKPGGWRCPNKQSPFFNFLFILAKGLILLI